MLGATRDRSAVRSLLTGVPDSVLPGPRGDPKGGQGVPAQVGWGREGGVSISTLPWLFGVLSGSIQILALFAPAL